MRQLFLFILFMLCLWPGTLSIADVILADERVDAQQITEIRYDAPTGHVLTGLGLRAHEDNITTMHCRIHRLTGDGKLTDPQEIHLGYDPEHACEATIMLPTGWVMVGFGAAGEPEWDITLLRVWARELQSDGSLGEIRIFNDGRNPERGPEAFVLAEEPDRVLTGLGTRFHQNNIASAYGRSHRLLQYKPVENATTSLAIRGMALDGFSVANLPWLDESLQTYGFNRLDIRLAGNAKSATDHPHISLIKAITAIARPLNVECHLWINSASPEAARRLLREIPELHGLVLSSDNATDVKDALALYAVCKGEGRTLGLPIARFDVAALKELNPEITFIATPKELSRMAELSGRTVIVQMDALGPADLPNLRLNEIAGALAVAYVQGARGFTATVSRNSRILNGPFDGLTLRALQLIAANPLMPAEAMWENLMKESRVQQAEQKISALKRTASIADLAFGLLGLNLLNSDGSMINAEEADALIQSGISAATPAAGDLLHPTDKTLERVEYEKETARWLLKQSIAEAEEIIRLDPSPGSYALKYELDRLSAALSAWEHATRALVLSRIYFEDGSAETRQSAEGASQRFLQSYGEVHDLFGSFPGLLGGLGFVDSINRALARADETSPVAKSFQNIRDLITQSRSDEAALALSGLLQDPSFAPHASKWNTTIAELASKNASLGRPSDDLHVLRGADGNWLIEKKGDRWAWTTGEEGPCLYFDVTFGPLEKPADYMLSFEYYDEGAYSLQVHYDSDYPGETNERQYHLAERIQIRNTRTWKQAELKLTNCLFSSSQNLLADMRFLADGGRVIHIRNVELRPVE